MRLWTVCERTQYLKTDDKRYNSNFGLFCWLVLTNGMYLCLLQKRIKTTLLQLFCILFTFAMYDDIMLRTWSLKFIQNIKNTQKP